MNTKALRAILLLAVAVVLPACSLDPVDEPGFAGGTRSYKITMTNLTNAQPLSPVAGVLHGTGYKAMTLGRSVSVGLEKLAEGGANGDFLTEAAASTAVTSTASTSGAVGPGKSGSIVLEGRGLRLSLATMLVNTNDAITGLNGYDLSGLSVNESMSLSLRSYDTGTEANTEAVTDMPGPAASGEGFNAARDDRNFLTVHQGVVTSDDGLTSSILTEAHRFDNPTASIVIERTS